MQARPHAIALVPESPSQFVAESPSQFAAESPSQFVAEAVSKKLKPHLSTPRRRQRLIRRGCRPQPPSLCRGFSAEKVRERENGRVTGQVSGKAQTPPPRRGGVMPHASSAENPSTWGKENMQYGGVKCSSSSSNDQNAHVRGWGCGSTCTPHAEALVGAARPSPRGVASWHGLVSCSLLQGGALRIHPVQALPGLRSPAQAAQAWPNHRGGIAGSSLVRTWHTTGSTSLAKPPGRH